MVTVINWIVMIMIVMVVVNDKVKNCYFDGSRIVLITDHSNDTDK